VIHSMPLPNSILLIGTIICASNSVVAADFETEQSFKPDSISVHDFANSLAQKLGQILLIREAESGSNLTDILLSVEMSGVSNLEMFELVLACVSWEYIPRSFGWAVFEFTDPANDQSCDKFQFTVLPPVAQPLRIMM